MFFNKSGDFYLFLYKKVYTFALKILETGYLDWMTEQTNFSYKNEQRLAKRYLELVQGS